MDRFICGPRGSGKTLLTVIYAWLDWLDGYQIWTNTPLHPAFDINFKTKESGNLHLVDAIDLIQLMVNDKVEDSPVPKLCILDEIKTQASSRGFGSYINKYLTDFISQARKRNFKMIYTDQILNAYDKWMRQMTDRLILSRGIVDYNNLGLGDKEYPEPVIFEYAELDLSELSFENPTIFEIKRQTARYFYPLYKTRKMIAPVELKQEVTD